MAYRSGGLGVYAVVVRYLTMPLEKIAMIMNSSQVQGRNQLAQAARICFADGALTPYRTVGRASVVAWFFQYSVMGFVFQACDRTFSRLMGTSMVPYGDELYDPPAERDDAPTERAAAPAAPSVEEMKFAAKALIAPAIAGSIESGVCNRAEAQRFWGMSKLESVEQRLKWSSPARACGPGFVPNATRNFVMSSTSFVVTPLLYKNYFPQEKKDTRSLFWFGLGVNIFFGNVIAITQQSLWGRALDYCAVGGGRPISYPAVISESLAKEGVAAFFTVPKWFARVMMNAPIQVTPRCLLLPSLGSPIEHREFIAIMSSS